MIRRSSPPRGTLKKNAVFICYSSQGQNSRPGSPEWMFLFLRSNMNIYSVFRFFGLKSFKCGLPLAPTTYFSLMSPVSAKSSLFTQLSLLPPWCTRPPTWRPPRPYAEPGPPPGLGLGRSTAHPICLARSPRPPPSPLTIRVTVFSHPMGTAVSVSEVNGPCLDSDLA